MYEKLPRVNEEINIKLRGINSMKSLKRFTAIMVVLTLMVAVFVGCGQKENIEYVDEKDSYVTYTVNELGFNVMMNSKLFAICTLGEPVSEHDAELDMDKSVVQINGIIEEVEVPLVSVHVYNGEFTEADFEEKSPMMVYAGTENGLTYTLLYSEEAGGLLSEEQLTAYNDIMNNYVVGMEKEMKFFEPGTYVEPVEGNKGEPLDDETLQMYLKETTPTDLDTVSE